MIKNEGAIPDVSMRSFVLRSFVPLVALIACSFLLQQRFENTHWSQIASALSEFSTLTVVAALILGLVSHLGLAGYDLLAFARIGRRIPWGRALVGGFSGTVVSQVVGLGLITGSYARSRIYRANDVSVTQAVALTGYVAASFFSGLCVLLGMLTVVNPMPAATLTGLSENAVQTVALLGMMTLASAAWLTRKGSVSVPLGGMQVRLPDGGWLTSATALAVFDLVPAALCLAILLPGEGAPDLTAFIAIYIVAVASGHLIGSPGAVGPFEAIIFLALPNMPIADLAAAVIAYRLVYYLPPFALALGFIAFARRPPGVKVLTGDDLKNGVDWILDEAGNPEAELAYLGDKHIYLQRGGAAFIMYGISGRIWLMLGDPIGPESSWPDLIQGFETAARATGAKVAIYKATDRATPYWQSKGYRVDPLGEEGVLDAQNFNTRGSDRRELRRKLSSSQKAGVTLGVSSPGESDLEHLATVADAWRAKKRGHEETFSMGHWKAGFANRHWVIVASLQNKPIAFLSCWVSGDGQEWMIDLMRQMPDAPNGTMYALVVRAIEAAAENDVARFNMCAAPMSGLDRHAPQTMWTRLGQAAYERLGKRHGLAGVRRFKAVFRPIWAQRYLISRNLPNSFEALLAARVLVHGRGRSDLYETPCSPVLPCPPAPLFQFSDMQDQPRILTASEQLVEQRKIA